MKEVNQLTEVIIGSAIAVHRALGPGLLESTYQACLEYELNGAGLLLTDKKSCRSSTKGYVSIADIGSTCWSKGIVIVEIKSVDKVIPIHEAQLLSYLKLAEKPVGLLINFNVQLLTQGVHRIVNKLTE